MKKEETAHGKKYPLKRVKVIYSLSRENSFDIVTQIS